MSVQIFPKSFLSRKLEDHERIGVTSDNKFEILPPEAFASRVKRFLTFQQNPHINKVYNLFEKVVKDGSLNHIYQEIYSNNQDLDSCKYLESNLSNLRDRFDRVGKLNFLSKLILDVVNVFLRLFGLAPIRLTTYATRHENGGEISVKHFFESPQIPCDFTAKEIPLIENEASPNIQGSQEVAVIPNDELSLDFQNSVKQGNIEQALHMIEQGLLVNHPLPNGEMPLHFAVRSNRQEVIPSLLKKGADPEFKDFQNLSAIDHAVLIKNESMLACILGHKIGIDLKDIQDQIKSKGSSIHVGRIKKDIETILKFNEKNLTPISKAAYQGSFDSILVDESLKDNINQLDANGLAPIHYAVLSGKIDSLEKLIELGADINAKTQKGNSLLHLAAAKGSLGMLNRLIDLGADCNHKNHLGETALHYASVKDNLSFVQILVKSGANPHLLDNQNVSSLSLLGNSAFERDPLSLSETQVLLFSTASLFWLSNIALASGWIPLEAKQTAALIISIAGIAAKYYEFKILLTNLNQKWKKVLAWTTASTLGLIPPFNIGFQAWNTYHVARSAFHGLKKCWKNIGFRNWAVARNIVVHSVNTAFSTRSLYIKVLFNYELYLFAPYLKKMWEATSEEEYEEAYVEFINFMNDRYKTNDNSANENHFVKIDPLELKSLSSIERLRKPELDPNRPEHALMMISPDFNMEQLRTSGKSLYIKTYRQLMLKEIHPDKVGSSTQVQEAAVRLNLAKSTLDNWVSENIAE
jgi:ankyrin repeat protein